MGPVNIKAMVSRHLWQNLNSSNLLPKMVNTPFATFQITSVTLAIRAVVSSADVLSQKPLHAPQEEKWGHNIRGVRGQDKSSTTRYFTF
jgi:hypothetical protein